MRWVLVLVLGLVVVAPRPSHACSCAWPAPTIAPVDRATSVPRNAVIPTAPPDSSEPGGCAAAPGAGLLCLGLLALTRRRR